MGSPVSSSHDDTLLSHLTFFGLLSSVLAMGTELFLSGEADVMSSFSRLRFLADDEESFAI